MRANNAWVGLLLMAGIAAAVTGCTSSRDSFIPALTVMSESLYTGTGASAKLLGEDCSQSRTCTEGACAKVQHGRGRGYFCSKSCVDEGDCPVDWLCRQVLPGAEGRLCIPPDSWTSRAVEVQR